MLRPKLRPTLSRKVKYWNIAPAAHKKLGKEARRGEHDLRKLVGHANFLDELIEEFHIDDESANPKYQKAAPKIAHSAASKQQKQEIQEDDDGESTASDDWSEYDSDDDEDHALVRTQSGRLHRVEVDAQEEDDSSDGEEIYGMMPALIKDVGSNASSADTSPASISEGTEDYFTQIAHAPVLAGDETAKHVEKVDVEIASPMSTR